MTQDNTPQQRKHSPHPAWARIAHALHVTARILGAILVGLWQLAKELVVWFFIGAFIGMKLFDDDE